MLGPGYQDHLDEMNFAQFKRDANNDCTRTQAQNNLGISYAEGRGVNRNYKKAVELFKQAAAKDYAKSQYNLGCMYENGRGVAQNYVKAIKLYEKAAVQCHVDAQYNLGIMYENGRGVGMWPAGARYWYGKAAEKGHKHAISKLKEFLGRYNAGMDSRLGVKPQGSQVVEGLFNRPNKSSRLLEMTGSDGSICKGDGTTCENGDIYGNLCL